ncbi:hypothetical protein PMIN07_012383 [Paraphaeosphaeria minitans]
MTRSRTLLPPAPPLTFWVMMKNHCFTVGSIIFHTAMLAMVLATPAMKLFRWTCRLGKYTKPPPAECGGMMKMS